MKRITRRFQRRAMARACHVPPDIHCPCCHHGYQIEVSRRQMFSNPVSRTIWRFYRCRVCDHRFRVLNRPTLFWPAGVALPAIVLFIVGFSTLLWK